MGRIEINDGWYHYFDINGVELSEGDVVNIDGVEKKLYETMEGRLGTDATNPAWLKAGKAAPGEYGIYPLEDSDMKTIKKIR